MLLPWLLAPLVVASWADPGSSLRSAVEALQRRQRAGDMQNAGYLRASDLQNAGYIRASDMLQRADDIPSDDEYRLTVPIANRLGVSYTYKPREDPEYPVDIGDIVDEPNQKYLLKLLEENQAPVDYEYKIVNKKTSHLGDNQRKESAFRERSHNVGGERLRDIFENRNEEEKNEVLEDPSDSDDEYTMLLSKLWAKYKNSKVRGNTEIAPPGIVKLYKEKVVNKRYPDNWGPIAFKRKRSSDPDTPIMSDYEPEKKYPLVSSDASFNNYDVSDDDKDDDWREEYSIAFQPLDDDSSTDLSENYQYAYESVQKRFPVTKRSSGPYYNSQMKRFAQSQNKHDRAKAFRSSAGTDPRIIKDLSKVFGGMEMRNPVKRDVEESGPHDTKPPQLSMMHQGNGTNDKEVTEEQDHIDHSHEHILHHPGISAKDAENPHQHTGHDTHVHTEHDTHEHTGHDTHDHHHEKPITVRKKSIDWSDYFGIDKRSKKFVHDVDENRLKQQYLDTFNKEVIYPLNSFRRHNNVKRNYVDPIPSGETITNTGSQTKGETDEKLDTLDKNLRNVESLIVDEALHYSDGDEQLDSKEEQEMKENMLQKLATAYSLEKMRKALKEFKQSLQTPRPATSHGLTVPTEETKAKRVAVKKEKVDIGNNEIPTLNKVHEKDNDFEEEQGAGHYLNGEVDKHFTEGYMGGSGRHRTPVIATAGEASECPVLAKIIERCRGVDLLAGDRGQLFLPLCSLHQICYICGEAPPTSCDLVFLAEADSTCEGDMGCQRAARSALMALQELHDNLADEMDGECEASPCLPATLKLNVGWQRALGR